MNPFKFLFGLFSCILILSACTDSSQVEQIEIQGLKPIYAQGADWKEINVVDSRDVENLGKIYYKDPFIYVSEVNQGIHIINNENPTNPNPIKFISIPGSKDIAIKGDYLYSDNITDLVVLDIADHNNISVVKRIQDIYPVVNQDFPEFHNGYFECVDASKGTVVGWESALLIDPKCIR